LREPLLQTNEPVYWRSRAGVAATVRELVRDGTDTGADDGVAVEAIVGLERGVGEIVKAGASLPDDGVAVDVMLAIGVAVGVMPLVGVAVGVGLGVGVAVGVAAGTGVAAGVAVEAIAGMLTSRNVGSVVLAGDRV